MFSFSSPSLIALPVEIAPLYVRLPCSAFSSPSQPSLWGLSRSPVESGGLHADTGAPLCATQLRLSIPLSSAVRWMKQGPFMSRLLPFCNEGKVRVTFLSWMKFTSPLAFVYLKAVLKDNFLIWNDEVASNSTFTYS